MSYCRLIIFFTRLYTHTGNYHVITGKLSAMLLESGTDFTFILIFLVH